MLSAISATRFAIRFAMMEYADVTPPCCSPPATEAALGAGALRAALGGGREAAPGGFLAGARAAAAFLGTPFNCGAPALLAMAVL